MTPLELDKSPFLRLVQLVDNTPSPEGLAGEHGFSAAIYLSDGSLWLWDSGASGLAARNAPTLNVDVAQACGLALSHGHWDHTGGVEAFLDAGFDGPIYAHPGCTIPRWSVKADKPVRSIGWQEPQTGNERLIPVRGAKVLAASKDGTPLLTMITDIPRLPGNVEHIETFYHDAHGGDVDHVADDACLVAHTEQGRVLILGCCHSGLANTLAAVDAATADTAGESGFACVLGGLHLRGVEEKDDPRVIQALDALKRHKVRSLRPGHCTGAAATSFLAAMYEGDFLPLRVGEIIRF